MASEYKELTVFKVCATEVWNWQTRDFSKWMRVCKKMALSVFQKDLYKKFYKSTAQIYRQPTGDTVLNQGGKWEKMPNGGVSAGSVPWARHQAGWTATTQSNLTCQWDPSAVISSWLSVSSFQSCFAYNSCCTNPPFPMMKRDTHLGFGLSPSSPTSPILQLQNQKKKNPT